MKTCPLISAFILLIAAGAAIAADLPAIPSSPLAKKKELLFSDDFERTELGKAWGLAVPTFTLVNGTLKGTQTKLNIPATADKPAVRGHQAVIGTDTPTRDSVIEMKFRFAGATAVSAELDDRNLSTTQYGHICMVRVTPKSVILTDQRGIGQDNEAIAALTDPAQKAERTKQIQSRSATFPIELAEDKWHELVLETVGDSMRASIDGKAVGFLKSSGIAHPTKSKVEFGCMGKDGYFDDIKIWNAEPAKP